MSSLKRQPNLFRVHSEVELEEAVFLHWQLQDEQRLQIT